VIAPNLKTVRPVMVVVVAVVVLVLARNAIAAVRSATLRVLAPRHPEAAQEDSMAVAVGTAVLVEAKRRGTLSFRLVALFDRVLPGH